MPRSPRYVAVSANRAVKTRPISLTATKRCWAQNSDNPKCFALTACRYEPVLNPAFERFATHYGFTIECLPPRDPQKKGKIERMVPYVRRLYEAHGEFISLDESQQYLNHKLVIANQRRHGTTQRQPIDDLTVECRISCFGTG